MLEYKHVHRNKFHQELVDAGIEVIFADAIDDSPFGVRLQLSDGYNESLFKKILENHNNKTPLEPLSGESRMQEIEQMLNLILTGALHYEK